MENYRLEVNGGGCAYGMVESPFPKSASLLLNQKLIIIIAVLMIVIAAVT
jgi:hypothetical protein